MNQHLQKIISDSKDISRQSVTWYKELSRPKQIGVALVVFALLTLIVMAVSEGDEEAKQVTAPKTVKLALVSELANNDPSLPLLGTITSTSEATIRAETSGKLTRVYKKLGDYVAAGQVIAEFENSGERAAVLQAEGAYDAAKVARDIARINSGTTGSSLTESKNSALNALNSSYISMEDAIRIKTDDAYTDPRTNEAHFNVLVPDSILVLSLEAKRKVIEEMLVKRGERNRTMSASSDLTVELNAVQNELQIIKTYLDGMATAYSKALEDNNYSLAEIASGKANISAARSVIAGAITSVTGARSGLTSALAAQEVAGKTSGEASSMTTADATVKQAQGAYNATLSRLEKTIIRSPISGTLNSLSISTGDFISAFTEIGVVSNNGALEVLAYVTEDDAKRIAVGNEVKIDALAKGVVTRIASAVDPRTKKIEVRIGLTDKSSGLVNGQSVRVTINKSSRTTTTSGPLKIPLSSLKLTPNGAYVFMVNATGTLETILVTEGAIMGEDIQILSGLSGSETIVVDARGLKSGMSVTVKE